VSSELNPQPSPKITILRSTDIQVGPIGILIQNSVPLNSETLDSTNVVRP
jgi:hypothetical protein